MCDLFMSSIMSRRECPPSNDYSWAFEWTRYGETSLSLVSGQVGCLIINFRLLLLLLLVPGLTRPLSLPLVSLILVVLSLTPEISVTMLRSRRTYGRIISARKILWGVHRCSLRNVKIPVSMASINRSPWQREVHRRSQRRTSISACESASK